MIILLGLGTFIGFMVYFWLNEGFDYGNWILAFISSFMIAFCVGTVSHFAIGYTTSDVNVEVQHANIVSLDRGSGASGTFFLGTGQIESKPVYFFYVPEREGYKLKHISAHKTLLVESDDVSPRLQWDNVVRYSKYPNFLYLSDYQELEENREDHKLFVPKGSIIRTFKP